MNQSINIVTNSLEYYDKNREKYDKITSAVKYYKLKKNTSDLDHNRIFFYDKDKKKIFETRYEIIGLYDNATQTWVWAWSVPSFEKNSTFISKKILNYGLDIPSKPENRFLKSELITSRFRISDKVQLDIHVSVASYISKNPMVFRMKRDPSQYDQDVEQDLFEIKKELKDDNEYVMFYLFLLDHEKI
jgi:hypothetical protein